MVFRARRADEVEWVSLRVPRPVGVARHAPSSSQRACPREAVACACPWSRILQVKLLLAGRLGQ